MALRHFLWIRWFSIQDRIGFYEYIMIISTQNNEEPLFSADARLIFTIFPVIVFLEKHPIYSNMCFWNIPQFSAFCLHWKLPAPISRSFSWDNNCRFPNNFPKTIAEKNVIILKTSTEGHTKNKIIIIKKQSSIIENERKINKISRR